MLFYSLKNNQEIYVTNTFGFPTHFRVMNYYRAWTTFNIPMYFKNSLIVTAATIVFTLIFSLMFSYAIARMQWKLQNAARLYITLGMFIPVQVIMIPLAVLVKQLHLNNTLGSLIVPYIAFNLAFSSLIFYGYLRNIPFELEEPACIDGASIYRCFVSIICPIIRPAIATVIIFIFLQAWNEFSMAYILISNDSLKTLPLGLLFFQGQFTTDWGAMDAAMVIASFPTVIIYLFFSQKVKDALTVGSAVKG